MDFKKSQTAMEFLILVSVVSVVSVIFISYSMNQFNDEQYERENKNIKDAALKFQTEIYLAATAEDGYERSFEMKEKLDGVFNYSIDILNNETLFIYGKKSSYILPIPKVKGQAVKGINIIKKEGGVINLN